MLVQEKNDLALQLQAVRAAKISVLSPKSVNTCVIEILKLSLLKLIMFSRSRTT